LLGGCSTPISALAQVIDGQVIFRGNILSKDGAQKREVSKTVKVGEAGNLGAEAAAELLANGGQEILNSIRNED